ncbi:MAG: terminase small subunit [Nitrospirota bacterium]
MKTLTPKQERFCQEIVIGQALSAAYVVAFSPKTMSKKTVNEKACRLAKMGKIRARITELRAPVVAQVQGTMANRLAELAYAMFLDPADCFDDFGRPLSIRTMPEHVRRAIAAYEVDPVSFVTKIKFVDKRSAIMDYSKLAGDIPREKSPILSPRRSSYDLSKLTDEELREHMRLRRKAMIDPTEEVHTLGHADS